MSHLNEDMGVDEVVASRLGSASKDDMDLTPMVDVTFLLLIFS